MIDRHLEHNTIKERARKKLERDMGPGLLSALNDPRTVEVMLNADGKLWQERLGEAMTCIGSLRAAQAQAIIETIAGYHGKEVTRHKPILEGELPLDGSRFAGQLPPVVPAPTFAIRKKAVAVFTLQNHAIGMQMQVQVAREAREQAAANDTRQGGVPFRPSSRQRV